MADLSIVKNVIVLEKTSELANYIVATNGSISRNEKS